MKFSIVIPVYNVATYLRECLDSVLAQTYGQWEAICVDDGSTDTSGEILDEYATKDCRFRVVHVKNGGVSKARNVGIAATEGDYVTFLDGDDKYAVGWLKEANRIIGETNADIVRLKATLFGEGSSPRFDVDDKYESFNDWKATQAWGWRTFCKQGWSWVLFIRKDRFSELSEPFPVGMSYMEDNIFTLRLVAKCRTAVQGKRVGYGYRQHGESACGIGYTYERVRRIFDEVLVFKRGAPYWDAAAVADMLCRVVVGCRRGPNGRDQSIERLIALKVGECIDCGAFDLSDIPRKWRCAFLFMVKYHTCLILDISIAMQAAWGTVLTVAATRSSVRK